MRSARTSVLAIVPAHCVAENLCGNQGWRVWVKLPDRSWWVSGFLCATRRIAWAEAWERIKALEVKRKHRID